MTDGLFLLAGFACLYAGGETLLRGALALGSQLRLPPMVIGLVLVGLGTSAPELAVGVDAALSGHGDIAVGNVVGSNIVNFALVLGLAAAIRALPTSRELKWRDMPALTGITLLAAAFLLDGAVSRIEGIVLLGVLITALAWAIRQDVRPEDESTELAPRPNLPASLGWLGLGIALLLVGAEATVAGGVALAERIGVSEAVIALTVTALGTGLPEIAATVVAVARNHTGIAIGNVIGSNMINLGMVLGVSALSAPLASPGVGAVPIAMLVFLTLLVLVLIQGQRALSRWTAIALLSSFGAYNLAIVA